MAYEEEEKKQYMVIKIKKPHHAERLAWIVVVALLLSIVMYQWIIGPDTSANCDEDSCATICKDLAPITSVKETTKTDTTTKTTDTTTKPTETSTKPTTTETKTENKTTATTPTTLNGKLLFDIQEVKATKKMVNNNSIGKITSVKYSINNQKKDFVPLVKFYVFDKQWTEAEYSEDFLSKCCEQTPLFELPLKAGAPILISTITPNFPSLSDLDKSKTIKLELYDKKTPDKLLAATDYDLLPSGWK